MYKKKFTEKPKQSKILALIRFFIKNLKNHEFYELSKY